MSPAAKHDASILLCNDIAEKSGLIAHYAMLAQEHALLGHRSVTHFDLKCAHACFKAVAASFKEWEALTAPKPEICEAAE